MVFVGERDSLLEGAGYFDAAAWKLQQAVMNIRSVSQVRAREIWLHSLRGLRSSPWYLWNGMVYAFTHGWVWRALIIPFTMLVVASIGIFLLLFFFLWLPQVAFIETFFPGRHDHGPAYYALYLVVQETNFIVNILFMVILDMSRRKIYDKIFELEGPEIKTYRLLSSVPTKERLPIVAYSLVVTITLTIATLPLLALPVGGSILIALATGWAIAWSE